VNWLGNLLERLLSNDFHILVLFQINQEKFLKKEHEVMFWLHLLISILFEKIISFNVQNQTYLKKVKRLLNIAFYNFL
jgi:hypothetical protein